MASQASGLVPETTPMHINKKLPKSSHHHPHTICEKLQPMSTENKRVQDRRRQTNSEAKNQTVGGEKKIHFHETAFYTKHMTAHDSINPL